MAESQQPPQALLEALRARVPAYMVPRRVVTIDALPLSMNGKLDRGALAARLEREADGRGA